MSVTGLGPVFQELAWQGGKEEEELDGDGVELCPKKCLKRQNGLSAAFLSLTFSLYPSVLQEIPGCNGWGRGEELLFQILC